MYSTMFGCDRVFNTAISLSSWATAFIAFSVAEFELLVEEGRGEDGAKVGEAEGRLTFFTAINLPVSICIHK